MEEGDGWKKRGRKRQTALIIVALSFYLPRSYFGGQRILLSGNGFGSQKSAVSVNIGPSPCTVQLVSDSAVECITSPVTRIHKVTNNA